MEIKDLTLEELKTIAAVLSNTSYQLGDANKVIPIFSKLITTIKALDVKETVLKKDDIITKK